jgi:hypothetical protein
MQLNPGFPPPTFLVVHKSEQEAKRPLQSRSNAMKISVTTMVTGTMIMMMSFLLYFLIIQCQEGVFTCSATDFPDISHTMGNPPYNKLYSMMLTCYSWSKQAEARAYYSKLKPFVNPIVNMLMLAAAGVSFIFGPMIGFFDVYYDKPHHMEVVKYFTLGEVIYLLTMLCVVSIHRSEFGSGSGLYITLFQACMLLFFVFAWLQSNQTYFVEYDKGAICEWIVFFFDFLSRCCLA